MRLPRPPQFETIGDVRRSLTQHLFWIQQEIEQEDAKNLKRSDIAERTSRTFRTVTATGAVGQGDDVVLADAPSGAITITLPPALDRYKEICIKKIDASGNAVTIDGNGAETIDDSTTLVLATQYDAVRLSSDGSEWWIL